MRKSAHLCNEIALKDRHSNILLFSVGRDTDYLDARLHLPSIPMVHDNDSETEWVEIRESVQNMSVALALSAYDRTYRR